MNKTEELYTILSNFGIEGLTLIDIGAAGGPNKDWDLPFVEIVGFEPDIKEFDKLEKNQNRMFFNNALSDSYKKIKLNICRKQ